jgi:hypothetical protein
MGYVANPPWMLDRILWKIKLSNGNENIIFKKYKPKALPCNLGFGLPFNFDHSCRNNKLIILT